MIFIVTVYTKGISLGTLLGITVESQTNGNFYLAETYDGELVYFDFADYLNGIITFDGDISALPADLVIPSSALYIQTYLSNSNYFT